jgi:uncharacterized protein (TIGR00255 family)
MTGYGRGEALTGNKKFTIELRAVNHRYSEVVLRLPRFLIVLEDRMRRRIQSYVPRGRVDVYLTIEDGTERNRTVKVDKKLALAYYGAITDIQKDLGLSGQISVEHIIAQPEVFSPEETRDNPEEWWPALEQALTAACDDLVGMREAEGASLRSDLEARLDRLGTLSTGIRERAPEVVNAYQARLTQRIQELIRDIDIDRVRLAQEVAYFAERCDIAEELVRLDSHFAQVRACLNGSGEPVGRRLDFLAQEMFREINTIGSKAQDEVIMALVVEFKSELEKTREQIQNIE